MYNKNKLIKIGNFLGDIFILQGYFIGYSLRGGIILGVFPSFLAVVKVLTSIFYKENPDAMKYEFQNAYRENFKIANQIAWPTILFFGLLIYDYYINKQILQNGVLKIVLLILIIFMLILITHLPISILRFDLKIKEYFKQAFFLSLSSPLELFSIIASLVLIEIIFMKVPILILFMGAPLLALPFAWFSYNSVEKVLAKKEGD